MTNRTTVGLEDVPSSTVEYVCWTLSGACKFVNTHIYHSSQCLAHEEESTEYRMCVNLDGIVSDVFDRAFQVPITDGAMHSRRRINWARRWNLGRCQGKWNDERLHQLVGNVNRRCWYSSEPQFCAFAFAHEVWSLMVAAAESNAVIEGRRPIRIIRCEQCCV